MDLQGPFDLGHLVREHDHSKLLLSRFQVLAVGEGEIRGQMPAYEGGETEEKCPDVQSVAACDLTPSLQSLEHPLVPA